MSSRLNAYHGPKKALLGNRAGRAPPAWREQASAAGSVGGGQHAGNRHASGSQSRATASAAGGRQVFSGSKILMSDLPRDVGQEEVEVRFLLTIRLGDALIDLSLSFAFNTGVTA
jgi:THO complex subunit 4